MSDTTQTTAGLRAYFDGLEKRLEHAVKNARGNGLDVDALEARGVLRIGLARQTLADIAFNLADTEATRANRDNLLAGDAWTGRAELLKDYSEQLNKLELDRLEAVAFVQWTIARLRAHQWEKMGAEYAIDRVVTPVIRGTDGQDPEAKETLRHIRQDPRKTDKFLAELRRAVDIKAAVDGVDAKLAGLPAFLNEARDDDAKAAGQAEAYRKAYLKLTERQKAIYKAFEGDNKPTQMQLAALLGVKKKTISRDAQVINAIYAKVGRVKPIVWRTTKRLYNSTDIPDRGDLDGDDLDGDDLDDRDE